MTPLKKVIRDVTSVDYFDRRVLRVATRLQRRAFTRLIPLDAAHAVEAARVCLTARGDELAWRASMSASTRFVTIAARAQDKAMRKGSRA